MLQPKMAVAADTMTSGLTTKAGRSSTGGRGRGTGRGGRVRGSRGHRPRGKPVGSILVRSKALLMTPHIQGNVFECFHEQTDQSQDARSPRGLHKERHEALQRPLPAVYNEHDAASNREADKAGGRPRRRDRHHHSEGRCEGFLQVTPYSER